MDYKGISIICALVLVASPAKGQSQALRTARTKSSADRLFIASDETGASENLVSNGSFELCPEFHGEYVNVKEMPGGNPLIPGWAVRNEIDVIQGAWNTIFGRKAIDLNGYNPGAAMQTIATVRGASYRVEFWIAGTGPTKAFFVRAAGKSKTFNFDFTPFGRGTLSWRKLTWDFVATDKKTVLEFGSLTEGNLGVYIDNVSVVKLGKNGQPAHSPAEAGSASSAAESGPNLIANGGFEISPGFSGEFFNVQPPSQVIAGWLVKKEIDLIQLPWKVVYGKKAIDLNGYRPGEIRQTFSTEPGAVYRLEFYISGSGSNPVMKDMFVRAGGKSTSFSFDSTGYGKGDLQWRKATWEFTAEKEKTTLEMGSMTPGNLGVFVDNVLVRKIRSGEKTNASEVAATKAETPGGITDIAAADERLQANLSTAAKFGFIQAGTDHLFQPNAPVTRGDLIKWFVRVKKLPPVDLGVSIFNDVSHSDPNFTEIETAAVNGLASGCKEGEQVFFKPQQPVTREEFAQLYCDFAGKRTAAENLSEQEIADAVKSSYSDIHEVKAPNLRFVVLAQREGVLSECFAIDPDAEAEPRSLLQPQKQMTRAEAVNILLKLYGSK